MLATSVEHAVKFYNYSSQVLLIPATACGIGTRLRLADGAEFDFEKFSFVTPIDCVASEFLLQASAA